MKKQVAALLLAAMLLVGGCSERQRHDDAPGGAVDPDISAQNPESEQPGGTSGAEEMLLPVEGSGSTAGESGASSGSSGDDEGQEVNRDIGEAETDWRLALVNSTHVLSEDYGAPLTQIPGSEYSFDSRAIADLNAMLADAKAAGFDYVIVSAYRSFQRSQSNYENKVNELMGQGMGREEALAEAARWIAPAGHSEHNTGLAIDLVSYSYWNQYGDLMHVFDQDPFFAWLYEHCAEYGFVLRYPEDKQDITGITYEPWHYRYVGQGHAQVMMEQHLCLEEYLQQIA